MCLNLGEENDNCQIIYKIILQRDNDKEYYGSYFNK